jgi:branched-chain amino acid transport system permease protein
VVGALFGLLAIRTTGVYFIMVTLAEGMLVWGITYRWSSVTGAENGIRGIARPPIIAEHWKFYYVVLVTFIVLATLIWKLVNSPFGLTLKGIRESESRMRTLGYNVVLHKWLAFTLASMFAGCAGALYALYNGFVSPTTVEFAKSAEQVLIVILGGVGTTFGAVIGAAIIIFTRNIVSLYTARWPTIMGLIFVLTVLFARDGVVGEVRKLLNWIWRERLPAGEQAAAEGAAPRPPARAEVMPRAERIEQ